MPGRRSDLQNTLQFALDILKLIPSRTYVTAKEICQKLEADGTSRDLRSVQRVLKQLADTYPQIEVYDRKKPFGYRWGVDAPKIMLPQMTANEALLLVMARDYLKNYLPQELQSSMGSYFREAVAVLNSQKTDDSTKSWLDKVRISPPTLPLMPPTIESGVLETVSHCLFSGQEMRIRYRNRAGEISDYSVHPYGFIDRDPVLMLVCDSLKASQSEWKIRTLALHRILEAQELSFRFEVPFDFNLDEFVSEGRHMWGRGERVAISFEIKASAGSQLLEAKLSEDQTVEICEDGWLRVSATLNESLELKRWLNSFGEDLRNRKMTFLERE
ncbi:MAG: WYL domain-containing protein [Gammaproteobacteria bacterium]|nr:WYL domain-containing protein [Gammaproteobacteria bacterium]